VGAKTVLWMYNRSKCKVVVRYVGHRNKFEPLFNKLMNQFIAYKYDELMQ
jgi:hypothetical protein